MNSFIVIVAAFLATFTHAAESTDVVGNFQTIHLSSDVATGIVLGFFFLGMLSFAITMMMNIQVSDQLGQPREAAPGKAQQ